MSNEDYLKAFVVVTSENEKLQARVDKAIKYINKHIEYGLELGKILHDNEEDLRNNVFFDISEIDEILNILKGGDSNDSIDNK